MIAKLSSTRIQHVRLYDEMTLNYFDYHTTAQRQGTH
jgi:hypothetical protein